MKNEQFKLRPHTMANSVEADFVYKFSKIADRNRLLMAITVGVGLDEIRDLGIPEGPELSDVERAALYARYQYKCSHDVAKRIAEEKFNAEQINVIMSSLIHPTYSMEEQKILDEILYAKFSAEEMKKWFAENKKA